MPIQFQCASCGHAMQLPDTAAGKQGKCPKCGAVVSVPAAGAAPLSTADEEFWSELPDEKDKPAYPQKEAPKKPKKRTDAQVLKTYIKDDTQLQAEKQLQRTGLPWEDSDEGFFDRYWDTAIGIMNHPLDSWATMKLDAGFGKPTTFLLLGATFGAFFNMLYAVIANVVMVYAASQAASAAAVEGGGAALRVGIPTAIAVFLVAYFFIGFFASIIGMMIGVFLQAGLLQLSLMIVGIKNTNYQTTFRVSAYCNGGIMVWTVIPVVGSLFALVCWLIGMVSGFSGVYNTSQGKATVAVLLPFLLLVLPVLVGIGMLAMALAGGG